MTIRPKGFKFSTVVYPYRIKDSYKYHKCQGQFLCEILKNNSRSIQEQFWNLFLEYSRNVKSLLELFKNLPLNSRITALDSLPIC